MTLFNPLYRKNLALAFESISGGVSWVSRLEDRDNWVKRVLAEYPQVVESLEAVGKNWGGRTYHQVVSTLNFASTFGHMRSNFPSEVILSFRDIKEFVMDVRQVINYRHSFVWKDSRLKSIFIDWCNPNLWSKVIWEKHLETSVSKWVLAKIEAFKNALAKISKAQMAFKKGVEEAANPPFSIQLYSPSLGKTPQQIMDYAVSQGFNKLASCKEVVKWMADYVAAPMLDYDHPDYDMHYLVFKAIDHSISLTRFNPKTVSSFMAEMGLDYQVFAKELLGTKGDYKGQIG